MENPKVEVGEESQQPERNLLAKTLGRAIQDAVNSPMEQYLKRQARSWLGLYRKHQPKEAKIPFRFLWICIELDICPFKTREAILEMIESGREFDPDGVNEGAVDWPRCHW